MSVQFAWGVRAGGGGKEGERTGSDSYNPIEREGNLEWMD